MTQIARQLTFLWLFLLAALIAACSMLPLDAYQTPATPISTATALPSRTPEPFATPVPYINTSPTITPYPVQTVIPTDIPVGVLYYPPNINPLTGLEVSDPMILARLPVMVKVSNWPRTGRPHAGLSKADMVFEYYIGEGFNRFLALYYGQDSPKVGPVRSGRLVDAQLVQMYRGFLVYGNADPKVDDVLIHSLGNRLLAQKDSPCPPICGKDTHDATGVFADTAAVTQYVEDLGINNNQQRFLYGMLFDETPPATDLYGVFVAIQFGIIDRGEWRYDVDSGKYLRWIERDRVNDVWDMIPMVDRNNDQQISFSNIIILFPHYITYAPTLHDIRVVDNRWGAPAIFYRDGLMYKGSWRVPDPDKPMQFFNASGLPMVLKPGNTWIVLASPESYFSEIKPGEWEMKFDIPLPTETATPTSTPES